MKINKITSYLIPLLYCSIVILLISNPDLGCESNDHKFNEIIDLIENSYVDTVNSNNLFEVTINDMLHKLDPHSHYIPARSVKLMNEMTQGRFGGIGISFFLFRDTVCIINVIPGSPAMRNGLKAGDKIISVNNKKFELNITNEKVMNLLKGIEGTEVSLTLVRENEKIKKTFKRGSIPIESVVASYMITKEVGYIKINQFTVSTSLEFSIQASKLKQQGLKKLILDLRDNGGGVLTGATEIADLFLSAGKPIVETKGENSPLQTYYATEKSPLIDVDLVLLINLETASASEILAGAIQDNDRGLVIGRRSFGKGLVQEDKQLNDGSNLRLTIARYYTPTGRCIQKPYSGDYDSYNQDIINRYENGEMYLIDSSQFIDSLKFITPKGRVVYGGGGIMPDIFVPYETLGVSSFYSELRSLNAFRTFVFNYVKDKRNKWSSPQQFNEEFNVTSSLLNTFLNFIKLNYKLEKQIKKNQASRDLIAQRMKAEIASQIWGEQGFYQVINTENEDIKEAMKAFN
ncbi:MAG: peptidase S41 [Crocinitomicaceae bacterium]|nr:peptidase S41 [Crocinitomicaceae bacterium]|tara:strand:+ start:51953 stop:53506 length:1554 start_codon:yes stop_codon:yes gene_type:complete